MAIIYAFCCLGFAALNDFVFKLFARKDRSRGVFVMLIGMVWLLVLGGLPVDWQHNLEATVYYGMLSGLFSVASNLLLIEAMSNQSAGVCSTIYRLNLVVVVIVAGLWLGEDIGLFRIAGVVLAVIAIIAFVPGGKQRNNDFASRRVFLGSGLWLAMLACLLRAGMGITYKWGFQHGADKNGVVIINSLFWIVGGLLYALIRERPWQISRKLVAYGVWSGLLISGIVLFMALSLKCGNASVVLPIAQMSFLGTFGLSIAFLKEPVTMRKIIAVFSGVAAIVLLVSG